MNLPSLSNPFRKRTQRRCSQSSPTRRTRLSVLPLESRVTPSAPIPVGPEFRVNTTTEAMQYRPQTAMAANGDFVAVWPSVSTSDRRVYGQRFNASGVPQGNEFQITTNLSGYGPNLAVAMDATGDFVVVWMRETTFDFYARRYNANGVQQGTDFPIATLAFSAAGSFDLDMDAAGNWAVAWESTALGPDRVFVRQFDSSGVPLGPEVMVDDVNESLYPADRHSRQR
jgi:hypothetical protein